MSIANKLTYLNTTKGKIKDSINLTGAGITANDTFRSYAVKLRDGLVNVLNNGTIVLYNNFPKVSGTGSNISLSNTLEAPMFMNKFDGDTYQQTYTGKNLFNYASTNYVENGTTTLTGTGNDFTISGSGNNLRAYCIGLINFNTLYKYMSNSYTILSMSLYITEQSSYNNWTSYSSNRQQISTDGNWNTNTMDLSNYQGKYLWIQLRGGSIGQGYTSINYKDFILAKESVSSYEPYVGGTSSPNPSYPQDIQSVEGIQNITISDGTDSDSYEVNLEGKNLWNNTQVVNTSDYIENNGTGFKLSKTENGRITPEYTISIPANTSIIITNILKNYTTSNGIIYCQWIATDNTIIWTPNINNTSITTSFNKDIKGVKFYLQTNETNGNYVEIENLMIRYASISDSEYVPYRSPIKLYDGDKIVGTPDNWSVVRNNNKYIVDTSRISLQDNYTNIEYAKIPKPSDYKGYGNFTPYDIICSKAKFSKYPSSYDNIQNINNIYADAARNDYWLGFAKGTGLTIIQEKLANTEIIYPIKTPTTEQITDTYLISQLNSLYNAKSKNGQTNISVSGQLPMILEVSALKDEI